MEQGDRSIRLLKTTILVLVSTALLALVIQGPRVANFGPTARATLLILPGFLPPWALASRGRPRAAAWILVLVVAAAPLIIALLSPEDPVVLAFETLSVLVASIFLRPREVLLLASGATAAIASLPLIAPGQRESWQVSGFAIYVAITAAVSAIAARHHHAVESDRTRMERQLILNDRMATVGILTAGITHEIRNSLTSVVLSLESLSRLSEKGSLAPEAVALVKSGQEATRRVKDIVTELQSFGRGRDDAAPSAVMILPIVESSLRISRHALLQRARVATDVPADLRALAHESRLAQVLLNLLINAAQAIPEGNVADNEIRVAARADGGRTIVEVRDTGRGIPPEIRERIFEPFFTTKPGGEGTGLGLWVTRNIVAGMGGEVLVESTPGRGTTFQVVLRSA